MEQALEDQLKSLAMQEVARILREADESVITSKSEADSEGYVTYTFYALKLTYADQEHVVDVSFRAPQDQQLPSGIVQDSVSLTQTITRNG